MHLHFYKYHGTGNDFLLIDNREKKIHLSTEQISFLCHRHFGIGADGLMLLELEDGYDFKMVYYNADGNESTMCGNGGRCITAFAKQLDLIHQHASFTAIDGAHKAFIHEDKTVSLEMIDVHKIEKLNEHMLINTGSPHYIKWVKDVATIDVFHEGRFIRNLQEFQPKGINVNFVEKLENGISVRTYERGVEDETLSCGTGVTAAAIAFTGDKTGDFKIPVTTPGGKLEVSFSKITTQEVKNIILSGPAEFVFEGTIELK